jgi:hypothetical protein
MRVFHVFKYELVLVGLPYCTTMKALAKSYGISFTMLLYHLGKVRKLDFVKEQLKINLLRENKRKRDIRDAII